MTSRATFVLAALSLAMAFGSAAPAARAEAAQGVDTTMQSYLHGDYAAALKGLEPLARDGFAAAEFRLGQMYDNGLGVEQSYARAARWYRRAAEQGYGPAEERLGQLYAAGSGVPHSAERAYFWLDQAAAHASGAHQAMIEDERYHALLQLPPAERLRASEAAAQWHAHSKALTPAQLAQAEAAEAAAGGAARTAAAAARPHAG